MIVLVNELFGNSFLVRLPRVSRLTFKRARAKVVCDYGCVRAIEIRISPLFRISSLEVAHTSEGLVVANFCGTGKLSVYKDTESIHDWYLR